MPYVPSVPYVDENIVTLVGGTISNVSFTPGAWNVLSLNEAVINGSWNKGLEQLHDFKDQMGSLLDDTSGWLALHPAAPITPGTISVVAATEPSMTVSDTSPAQVYSDFNTQVTDAINALSAKFASFIASKFPNEQTTYDAAESYLVNAINNPPATVGGPAMTVADTTPAAVYLDFDNQASDIITDLRAKFTSFMSTNYPNEPLTYAAFESYLLNVINNPPTKHGGPVMTIDDTTPASVYLDFNDQTDDIILNLTTEFESFLATKYPNEPVNYAAAEAYLLQATTNATSNAIPDAIKAKIIADGRTEIVASAARAFGDAITKYAAMRHPLPPGALAAATTRIAQDAITAETSLIRGVAIKDFELAYQKIKDAVSAILANRPTAFNSARDFIVAAIQQGYLEGGKIVATAHNAEASMINAATGFYNATTNDYQLAYEKLKTAISTALANRSSALNAAKETTSVTVLQGYSEGEKLVAGAHNAETSKINAATGFYNATINDYQLAYAKLKDAISLALTNRTAALNATKEFILATTGQGYIEGGKITATAHAAETAMLNAASGYFNARINAQELLLKADIADETLTNDAEKANQQAELEQIQDYLKGFLAQAQALAAIATALTNNIRAGANSSYNVSI